MSHSVAFCAWASCGPIRILAVIAKKIKNLLGHAWMCVVIPPDCWEVCKMRQNAPYIMMRPRVPPSEAARQEIYKVKEKTFSGPQ